MSTAPNDQYQENLGPARHRGRPVSGPARDDVQVDDLDFDRQRDLLLSRLPCRRSDREPPRQHSNQEGGDGDQQGGDSKGVRGQGVAPTGRDVLRHAPDVCEPLRLALPRDPARPTTDPYIRRAEAKIETAAFRRLANQIEREADAIAITHQDPTRRAHATWPAHYAAKRLRAEADRLAGEAGLSVSCGAMAVQRYTCELEQHHDGPHAALVHIVRWFDPQEPPRD